MLRTTLAGCFVFLLVGTAIGQSKKSPPANNQELRQLYMDDQHDRGNEPFIEYDDHGKRLTPKKEWKALSEEEMSKRDMARRKLVQQMLAAGTVRTGEDYTFASFIFQHGTGPDDFLLAHILATVALSKGYKEARWIAAAALDRYLQSMKQPQVFGTQFPFNPSHEVNQGNYNVDLISDSVRAALCVIPLEKQKKQVEEAHQKNIDPNLSTDLMPYLNTGIIPCP